MQPFKRYINTLLLVLLTFSAPVTVLSQESEEALKQTAEKLFADEKYAEAKTYVERLLALQPRSFDYQYKYGTCLLYSGYKKTDAFKYLQYSVTDPNINVAAYFFLGKAYHLTYQFNDAIKNYNLYKSKAGNNINPKFEVDRQIQMCNDGKSLLSGITEIVVLEKREYSTTDFFRIYDLRNIGGEILVAADFQSKIDKKKNYTPLIHFPPNSAIVYYASYGDSDKGQKDIYCCKRLPDKTWGAPQLVTGGVNTLSDEDFPYMHPNGQYLYFSSKGHNSMGGYDIFRAKINTVNGSFGEVENVDFAISSADNDLFYVVDSLDQNACFASSRQSNNGKMYVYKVKVNRLPMQLAVIKGDFASAINPENRKITINVKDAKTNEAIGTFVSDSKGKYLVTLPKSGSYTYEMKVEGSSKIHKYQMNVPYNKEFKPLKQRIDQEMLESNEIVKVTDLFNENFDDPSSILAEVIQQKAELNVNFQDFTEEQLTGSTNSAVLATLGVEGSSPQEKAEKILQIAGKQDEKAKAAVKMEDGAKVKALKALNDADKKQLEAKGLVAKSANETDQEKYKLLKEAQALMDQADELKAEAATFMKFSDSIATKAAQEDQKAKDLKTLSDAVFLAAQSNDDAKIKTLVEEKGETVRSVLESDQSTVLQPLIEKKKGVVQKENKAETELTSFKNTEKSIIKEIETLKAELEEAKAKDKPAIESKISSKENELKMVREETVIQAKKLDDLKTQEKVIDAQLTFLQEVNNTTFQNAPTAEAVRQRQTEVDSKNAGTLNDYIDQQVGILEKKEQIATYAGDPSSVEANALAEKEWKAFQDQLTQAKEEEKSLDEAANLTPVEKAQMKVGNDKKTLVQLEETKKSVAAALAKDPSSTALKARLEELENTEKATEEHIVSQQRIIENTPETVEETFTPEKELKTIFPSYETEKKAIKETNPLDQLKALNQLDEKLVSNTETEIGKIDEQLAQNPTSKNLTERKKALERLKTQTENNISSRQKSIDTMEPATVETPTAESVLKQLDPGYAAQQAAVSSPDKRTELEARNEIDQELLFSINAEKQKLADQLAGDPQNNGLKARKTALESLETKTKSEIAKRNEEIKMLPVATVVETTTPEEQLVTIDPDYNQKLARIDKTEREKELKSLIALNESLVTSIKDELGQVNELLLSQPENKTNLNRKEALQTLLDTKEQAVSADKEELKTFDVQETNPARDIAKTLVPDYESSIAAIETSGKTEEEKTVAKVEVEQALLDAVNARIKENEKLLDKDPAKTDLIDQNNELKTFQAIQEAKVEEGRDEVVAIERAKIEPLALQKTIAPKFVVPTPGELATQNGADQKELQVAEQTLRDQLAEKIQKNEKALAKEFDPKLVAENRAINVLIEQSTAREGKIGETAEPEPNALDALLAEAAPEEKNAFSATPATIEELNDFRSVLENMQTKVMTEADSPNFNAAERNTKRVQAVGIQQRLTELNAIEKTLRSSVVADTANNVITDSNPEEVATTNTASREIAALENRENVIEKKLQTATTAEAKQLNKELKVVQREKAALKDSVQIAEIVSLRETKKALTSELPDSEAAAVVKQMTSETDAKATKDQQIIAEQKKLALVEAVKTSTAANKIFEESGVVAAAPEELAKSKRQLMIEVGDLEREISVLKKTSSNPARVAELERRRTILNDEITRIEAMEIASQPKEIMNPLLAEGLKTAVTPEKEMEIRSNPAYQEALIVQQELSQVQSQRRGIEKETAAIRQRFNSPDVDQKQLVEELKALETQEKSLKSEEAALENKIKGITASKGTDSDAWLNVVSREMSYVKAQPANEEVAPFVADGFRINQPNENVKPVLNKDLPIGIKMPSGLVYRVQVGAFAKPVPEELFKEFTPVTGEKLNNGITRYMAGFFGDRQKVLDAQKQIRTLGYNDAFVVAYCDGERISLAEARRLEDAGLCVPKDQNEITIEVTQNVIAQLPQDSLKPQVKEIKPGDYNKAEGAAEAMAVEERLGLFFTVQVGVYNKPVPSSQIKDIKPLITKRLENGQIRYSSGVFHSVAGAVPKKKEAISLGISDAFITAYYKGERIPLDEAKRILAEQGTAVLEPLETAPVSPQKVNQLIDQAIIKERTETGTVKQGKAELVSVETYRSYPEKEIQALNTVGAFYFDSLSGRIKSVEYSSAAALPSVANAGVSFDTLSIGKIEKAIQDQGELIDITVEEEIDAALANYLLRGNIPFETVGDEETKVNKIRIFASKTPNFTVILNQLTLLGVTYVARNAFDNGE